MNAQVTQLLIGAVPIVVAVIAYRTATRANRITAEATARVEREKVDAAAFDRAKQIYESAVQQLERQLDRIQEQLSHEQDTSVALRARVADLERTVSELRRQLEQAAAGLPVLDPIQED